MSEHAFNLDLGKLVVEALRDRGLAAVRIAVYVGSGYSAAMQWLAAEHKRIGAQVSVELHFNSADNETANGHEWLYWRPSTQGRFLAKSLDQCMQRAFPQAKRRGIRSVYSGDRGSEYLRMTHCPACICEPFFGSNAAEWQQAVEHKAQIAEAIANGIDEWLGGEA